MSTQEFNVLVVADKLRSEVAWLIELLKELDPDAGSPEANLMHNLKTSIKQYDKMREKNPTEP